tara:strand:- start:639 stop:1196 length:558 start_codon:yes stop_codon:yes gene_type:complete
MKGSKEETASQAHEYAWRWFAYHADQRLKSFHFFFILEGAVTAAYLTSLGMRLNLVASCLAVILFLVAVLFWRLDQRNSNLIKISEKYLKQSEENMALALGEKIRLIHIADSNNEEYSVKPFNNHLSSYRTIFRAIFICVGIFAIVCLAIAACPLITHCTSYITSKHEFSRPQPIQETDHGRTGS